MNPKTYIFSIIEDRPLPKSSTNHEEHTHKLDRTSHGGLV